MTITATMAHATRYWSRCDAQRVRCEVCPRQCRLRDGQRGLCFVRANHGGAIVLTTWGRSSGYCIDPIEKKPLYHFLPGTPVLSTLLIPGHNDGDAEIDAMTRWVVDHLGVDVPLHFSAFHPDWRMRDVPPTPLAALTRARRIALGNGVRHAYTGNVHDPAGTATYYQQCGELLIGREGYRVTDWRLSPAGACTRCGTICAGVFAPRPGNWGSRRQPIHLAD